MEYFLPSEIGRLVLGYLKEEDCNRTYQAFLNECVHLREYAVLLRRGREYPTCIGEKSLKQMLNEYGRQNAHEKQAKGDSLDGLWLKHDTLITQLRGRCMPSQNLARPTAGAEYTQVQAARTRRHNRPTPSAVCLSNLSQKESTASSVQNDSQDDDPMEVSQASSPEHISQTVEAVVSAGDSDSDDALVVETGLPESPVKTSQPQRTNAPLTIRTLSPKALGSLKIDISTGQEVRNQSPGSPLRVCSAAKTSATPSKIPVPKNTPRPSTSSQGRTSKKSIGQENRLTNHQRNMPASQSPPKPGCSSTLSKSDSDKVENNSATKAGKSKCASSSKKSTKPVNKIDSPKQVRVTRRRTRQQIAKEKAEKTESAVTTTVAEVHNAPTTDLPEDQPLSMVPLTPRKSLSFPGVANLGKSPRRKCPVPKRRSGCREEAPVNQSAVGGSAGSANSSGDDGLSMPLLDDLINNINFANKLAQSINLAKQVTESSQPAKPNSAPTEQTGDSGLNTPVLRAPSPEPKKKRKKVKTSTEPKPSTSSGVAEVTNDEGVGNVLHLQDSVMTEEAMRSIIEMTRTEPAFDALFHMFNVDKDAFISEEYEKTYNSQTSSEPQPSTSTAEPMPEAEQAEEDGFVTPIKTAKVLYPAKDGTPEYVQTVEIAGIHEMGMAAQSESGASDKGNDAVFKVPDPPRTEKPKEKTESTSTDKTDEAVSVEPVTAADADPADPATPTTPTVDIPKRKSNKGGFKGRQKQKKLGIASKKKSGRFDCSSTDSDNSDRPSTPTPPNIAVTYNQPATQPALPGVSPGIPQLVTPMTGAALGASGCSIVDLGHVNGPATISVVTSNDSSTVVHSSSMPSFNVIEELAIYTRGSTPVTQTGTVYSQSQSLNRELFAPQQNEWQPQQQIETQQPQTDFPQQPQQQEQLQHQQPENQQLGNQQQVQVSDQQQQLHNQQNQSQQQQQQQQPDPDYHPQQNSELQSQTAQHIEALASQAEPGEKVHVQHPKEAASSEKQSGSTCNNPALNTAPCQNEAPTCDNSVTQVEESVLIPTVPSGDKTPSLSQQERLGYAASPLLVVDSPHPICGLSQVPKCFAGASVGKAGSLIGSPFYSNPETPGLGGNEVVVSESPASASPYSAMAAGMQQGLSEETPRTSRTRRKRPSGSARTRVTWPEAKSLKAAHKTPVGPSGSATDSISSKADDAQTSESHIKENTTPEKVPPPPEGGGTPLATKEAEVAATMVAMASTPIKDNPRSRSPAGNTDSVREPQNEQLTESQNNNNEEVPTTPTKQKIPCTVFVSPERSPLLNKLIQASTDAVLNGHGETPVPNGDSNGRASGTKRPRSEEGKKLKQRSSKKIKLAKMDVDKFLAKVHDPS